MGFKLPKLSNGNLFGWRWSVISLALIIALIAAVLIFDIPMRSDDVKDPFKDLMGKKDTTTVINKIEE